MKTWSCLGCTGKQRQEITLCCYQEHSCPQEEQAVHFSWYSMSSCTSCNYPDPVAASSVNKWPSVYRNICHSVFQIHSNNVFVSTNEYSVLLVYYRKPVIFLFIIENDNSTFRALYFLCCPADRDIDRCIYSVSNLFLRTNTIFTSMRRWAVCLQPHGLWWSGFWGHLREGGSSNSV